MHPPIPHISWLRFARDWNRSYNSNFRFTGSYIVCRKCGKRAGTTILHCNLTDEARVLEPRIGKLTQIGVPYCFFCEGVEGMTRLTYMNIYTEKPDVERFQSLVQVL